MKKQLVLLSTFTFGVFVFAQGPLTPPGAPAPSMKTLDQIEARTPISALPASISASGSYYLTGMLSVTSGNGITISADDVTIDLNGFVLSSTTNDPGTSGIAIEGTRRNIAISNGHIRGPGFTNGIKSIGNSENIRVRDINVYNVTGNGIDLASDDTNIISRCSVKTVGGDGIRGGVVEHCTAKGCAVAGLVAETAMNCRGVGGTSFGIRATTAINCKAISTSGIGLSAESATNCTGQSTSGHGLDADQANSCQGISQSSNGILGGRIENCSGESTSAGAINAQIVNNSRGSSSSGIGLHASISATNSFGETTTGGIGLRASGTASFCRGQADGATAIDAPITIGCLPSGTGTVNSSSKHLGTP